MIEKTNIYLTELLLKF